MAFWKSLSTPPTKRHDRTRQGSLKEQEEANALVQSMTDDGEEAVPHSEMPPKPPGRILPLSDEAIAAIHSSKHITSLQGVVFALLENCLDAGATRVEISVDWRRGGATVIDNGNGIPQAEFNEDGGLGKLYCTSKRSTEGAQSSETHGSSGTFLAELAAMSLLSITSTHFQGNGTAMLTLHHGKVINRRLPGSALGPVNSNAKSGTDVNVRDLFGNMPVRIKQRALAGDVSYEEDKSWHDLKRGVVALLLAWPNSCSVKLRDANVDPKIATITGHHPGAPNSLTTKSLHQLAGKPVKSDPRDALPILFQAGFATPESRSRWIPLSASTSAISLRGLVCLDPAPTKQCQFLAIGIIPCSTTSGHNLLYDVVTKVFSNSSFGMIDESVTMGSSGDGGKKATDGNTAKQLQARKGVDRLPMYYIQLKFKDRSHTSASDLERLSDSSLKAVADILEAACTTWLESHHFRPRKKRRRRNEEQDSPSGPLRAILGKRSAYLNPIQQDSGGRNANVAPPVRGKVIDFSERPGSRGSFFERNTSIENEDLGTLSRMRLGRIEGRPQSAVQRSSTPQVDAEAQRARSATSSTQESLPMMVKKQRTLQAPSIDAGELGGRASRHFQTSDVAKPCNGFPSSDDFGKIDDDDLLDAERADHRTQFGQLSADHHGSDGDITWTDPVSKQVFRVNTRTGVVLPLSEESRATDTASERPRAAIDSTLSSKGKPLSLARRNALAGKENAERPDTADDAKWLSGFLKQWNNPVFTRQKEEPIPVAFHSGPGPLEPDVNGRCCSHDHIKMRIEDDSKGTKLTKSALTEAEVISQVDTKFILCKMPSIPGDSKSKTTLVLIDQHAASERIMLENLLTELCVPCEEDASSIRTTCLRSATARAQALMVEISSKELNLFGRHRAHFARWGIRYDLVTPARPESACSRNEANQSRIRITHLPTPVAERCANFPSLAIDMLRGEVWALEDGSRKVPSNAVRSTSEERDGDQPLWLSLLSAIPPSLLELLHSRSCRSAIMFNDVLSREQCVELVEQLGACVFPFVCAHGRISMVPLGDLGVASADEGFEQRESQGMAMSAWLRSRKD